jgi:hypothetical protein
LCAVCCIWYVACREYSHATLCSYLDRLDEIDLLLAFVVVGAEALPPASTAALRKVPSDPLLEHAVPVGFVAAIGHRLTVGTVGRSCARVRWFVRYVR